MAKIAGNDLHVTDANALAGAAFPLNDSAWDSEEILLATGQQVWLARGSLYANVTFSVPPQSSKLLLESHEAVQQGLDLLSAQRHGDFSIPSGPDRCLLWWRDGNVVRARYLSMQTSNFRVSAAGLVVSAAGTVVTPQQPPVVLWEPAFRYYRYSQVANDLYESYRNLYLAFESILSTYIPSTAGLGDRDWTKQALSAVETSGIDLGPYVQANKADVVDTLFQEQYVAHRCALFHAKKGQNPLLPGYFAERETVAQAHARLSQLVSLLLSKHFGVQQHTGGITPYGFSAAIQTLAATARLGVSSTPSVAAPPSAATISQRTDISRLSTEYKGAVDEEKQGREHEFRGRGQVARFLSPVVHSVLFWASEDEEGGYVPVDELDLGGVDAFEVRLIVAMNNRQMPRHRFAY